jgi:hypothetical protein
MMDRAPIIWTATQALTWLAYGKAETWAQFMITAIRDQVEERRGAGNSDNRNRRNAAWKAAMVLLIEEMIAGRLQCVGLPVGQPESRHIPVPPTLWLSAVTIRNDAVTADGDQPIHVYAAERNSCAELYRDLRFISAEVMGLRSDGVMGQNSDPVPNEPMHEQLLESLTLYHAIGLLAYRDDAIARRYGAKPGETTSGRARRRRDTLYPTLSGLPGTEVFKGIEDEGYIQKLMQGWEKTDANQWLAAKQGLWNAALTDAVPAFSSAGRIDRDFWLTHSLDSTEVQMFRFRRSDLVRLVVPVAAKRIAELQSAREPVLAVLPHHRAPAPNSDLLTACEVLTWIAFGKPLTQYCLGANGALMLGTWGTDQLGDLRIALEARAAEQPYTPLAGAFDKPWLSDNYVGQSWAKTARAIRARARQREQRMVSFVDLRDQLVRERDRSLYGDKLLEMASARLQGALAAGRLTAFGRRHEGSEHEPIKATVFMDSAISINWWDMVESESNGRRFDEVQFKTAEVLTVWPAVPYPDLPLAPRQETGTLSASQPVKPEFRSGAPEKPARTNSARKERRGRRPKYDWEPVILGLGAKLAAGGWPARGDGGQAKLESWVREQFPADSCPAESVIRAKVANAIAAHRRELGVEAGK